MSLEQIFQAGLKHHHITNTAYPISRKIFEDYKVEPKKEVVLQAWSEVQKLGVYVHIPFCEYRCKFCDYTVIPGAKIDEKELYIQALLNEIDMYKSAVDSKTIVGFDIGGGTPTALSIQQLETITNKILSTFKLEEGAAPSIETTPRLASEELEKLKRLNEIGFKRLSMGVQSINPQILENLRQKGNDPQKIVTALKNAREAGFENVNLDLMYGFKNQSVEDLISTIEFTIGLKPETITLYRMLFKGTAIEHHKEFVHLEDVNKLYDSAFNCLTQNGYHSEYGRNTFCLDQNYIGLSSYLGKRSLQGMPYLGFGLGAQSMFNNGLAYNAGKANKSIKDYVNKIGAGEFPLQNFYFLPKEEMLAKAIAVSFYSEYIDLNALSERFEIDLKQKFKKEIEFLKSNNLMQENDGLLKVTKEGHEKVNGIIPLFYSQKAKEYLLSLG